MNDKPLTTQIEDEIAALGGTLGDGFTPVDIALVIECACRVFRNAANIWDSMPDEERARIISEFILALDDQYGFIDRTAEAFVAWDIPGMPDTVVDSVLNKNVVRRLLRGSIAMLVDSSIRQLNRRSERGVRAWECAACNCKPKI